MGKKKDKAPEIPLRQHPKIFTPCDNCKESFIYLTFYEKNYLKKTELYRCKCDNCGNIQVSLVDLI